MEHVRSPSQCFEFSSPPIHADGRQREGSMQGHRHRQAQEEKQHHMYTQLQME